MKTTVAVVVAVLLAGCAVPKGSSVAEKRTDVVEMSKDALADFYAADPRLKLRVRHAPAYAVFSSLGMKFLVCGSGQGYGLVVENPGGEKTYMRMGRFGGGVGIGVKDYRTLLIFADRKAARDFVDSGFKIGGDADAAAKFDSTGVSANLGVTVTDGVTIYQLTKSGLSAEAMVYGTKYSKDDELN